MSNNSLAVEVVFASQDTHELIAMSVPAGTTLLQAIEQSGILLRFPEIDLQVNRVGIFGELKQLTDVLSEGDRVEIYRPLNKDPMLARRDRVVVVKKKKFKPLRAKDLV
jgi:putative ubiquitin-RnfH superfamily antitoxin RatB of RatAB toxin-antitoxin module